MTLLFTTCTVFVKGIYAYRVYCVGLIIPYFCKTTAFPHRAVMFSYLYWWFYLQLHMRRTQPHWFLLLYRLTRGLWRPASPVTFPHGWFDFPIIQPSFYTISALFVPGSTRFCLGPATYRTPPWQHHTQYTCRLEQKQCVINTATVSHSTHRHGTCVYAGAYPSTHGAVCAAPRCTGGTPPAFPLPACWRNKESSAQTSGPGAITLLLRLPSRISWFFGRTFAISG